MYDNLLDFLLYMNDDCKSTSYGIELPLPLSYPYEGSMGLLDHCYIASHHSSNAWGPTKMFQLNPQLPKHYCHL